MIKTYKKKLVLLVMILLLIVPNIVIGSGIENSQLAKGTEKLLDDLQRWLPVIAVGVGAVAVIGCFIARTLSDEMNKKKWSDRITTAIVSTIGATIGASIVSLFIGYYK